MNASHHHQAWTDVAVFEQQASSKSLEIFLVNRGIEARTYDDRLFRYFLFLRPPKVTYRVQVRQNQLADVNDLLNSEPPSILDAALHCPSCRSLRVNFPQMTRRFVLPTVLLHAGIIFRIIEHQCYCEHCHEMWPLSDVRSDVQPAHAVKPV
jgi:hypothetical protein